VKLNEYCKDNKVTLPIKIIARIVGLHPNYINELWKKGELERVNRYINYAEKKFREICK
jgi:hypothetical protein